MNPQSLSALDFLTPFLNSVPEDQFVQLVYIHPGEVENRIQSRTVHLLDLPSAVEKSSYANDMGYGVYFRLCPVSEMLPNYRRGGAELSSYLPAFWVDIDSAKKGNVPSNDADHVARFDPLPSAVVLSGNGVHAYWLLKSPQQLCDANRALLIDILRGLAARLGGDPSVAELSRVMRLPSFVNTKAEAEGRVVTVCQWHPERRYELDSFRPLRCTPQSRHTHTGARDATTGIPAWGREFLTFGAPEGGGRFGGRNNTAYRLAYILFANGHSTSEVETSVGHAARVSGLPEHEVEHLIQSAQRRARP